MKFRQNKLTRMKSSLFVILRKMQFAPNAFLNSLWTFSLEQLQRKENGAQRAECRVQLNIHGREGLRKTRTSGKEQR